MSSPRSHPTCERPTKRHRFAKKVELSAAAGLGICDGLFARELSSSSSRFKSAGSNLNLKHLRLQECLKCYDTVEKIAVSSPYHHGGSSFRRSKIVDVVSANNFVFCLSDAGYCAAFRRPSLELVCSLNTSEDESIRSLFFNQSADSLVTVSVWRQDRYSVLKCRSVPLSAIWEKSPALAGSDIFVGEGLRFPGFVEFDDTNGVVLTYAAAERVYKFWRLHDYSLLFEVSDPTVQEVKLSAGMVLLVHSKFGGQLPMSVLSVPDGKLIRSFHHGLHRHKQLDFLEQFEEKVVLKQRGKNVQILDINTLSTLEVESTEALTPQTFIFMHDTKVFMTRQNDHYAVFNFRGERVSFFADPMAHGSVVSAAHRQQLLIVYQRKSQSGCLRVFDVMTGECVCTVVAGSAAEAVALDDVTMVHYDDERGELFTGNENGRAYRWSS
eukprot:TRINITY_DN8855_c0_g1_i1.p1 TRINITY_DN8855_c0_g1~~TRINITY_DN8855_c0_g1_i1.p1  ORF type:complete len:439 (-),score=15.22 TRINITY_DN8855_c0_g1_i1:342-1658(-)